MGVENLFSNFEDGLLPLDGNARVTSSIGDISISALLDLAGTVNTGDVGDTLDSSAVTTFVSVQVTLERNNAATTALEVILGVEALPRVSAATVDTASRVANRALDAVDGELTLVVATGRAVLVDATLSIAHGVGPLADARVGEEQRVGRVPILAVEVARQKEAALGDSKSGEVARLGALEWDEPDGALLELSDGLGESRREESGSKESSEDGLHDDLSDSG